MESCHCTSNTSALKGKEMNFVKLDRENVSIYAAWFEDAELRKRLSLPDDNWLNYITSGSNAQAWLCYDEGQAVAHIQLDTEEDKSGSIALAVKPSLRGQGIGTKVLREFVASPLIAHLDYLEAGIEEDNLASQRVFSKAGFVLRGTGADEEGFLHFIYLNPEIETLWMKEVERRLELVEQGKMKIISGEEVRQRPRKTQ
jgi:RimJ/RimL family protein N-acetyltransferase